MATILAPYNTAMQLGAGFNSYTQQLCVDHAVLQDKEMVINNTPKEARSIAQSVSYRLSIVDKVTDVTDAMNINAAFSIKYDAFDAKGKGGFVNTSKVKESDVSFMIQVRVVNEAIYDNSLVKFNPIAEVKGQNFVDVYGDCFISGFQQGGEFTALISIKANDRAKSESIKANAAINFTKEKLQAGLEGDFGKDAESMMRENETTISVAYSGGGQNLKKDEEDWTFENMRAAALRFPSLVAETPIRTHAILTKYTALRSYYSATLGASRTTVPDFERAGVYTSFLQEAFLDYKAIAKNLQILAFDVSSGTQRLLPSPAERAAQEAAKEAAKSAEAGGASAPPVAKAVSSGSADSDPDTVVVKAAAAGAATTTTGGVPLRLTFAAPLRVTKPFPPTIEGLEQARTAVRQMQTRIVQDVDAIAKNPDLAVDEGRELPHQSPALFRQFVPLGESTTVAPGTSTADPATGTSQIGSSLVNAADPSGLLQF